MKTKTVIAANSGAKSVSDITAIHHQRNLATLSMGKGMGKTLPSCHSSGILRTTRGEEGHILCNFNPIIDKQNAALTYDFLGHAQPS